MFVVIEGLDGAGKSTQVALLRRMLAQRGVESEYLHFPRFDAPVYGELIARFLRGEFGGADSVDPYLVALLFAGDRADAAQTIRTWLAEGRAVVLDRYVWSNVAYQCARLRGGDCERRRLRDWILDVSLFLDVPFAFVERKLAEQREGADRSYLRGAQDIYESSLALQRAVRGVYLDAAASDAGVRLVDCSDAAGGMAPPECVFDRICTILEPFVVRP